MKSTEGKQKRYILYCRFLNSFCDYPCNWPSVLWVCIKELSGSDRSGTLGYCRSERKEIMQWREERLGDVSVFYKNDVFSSLVQRYFEKPDDAETLKGIQIWLRNVQVHYVIEESASLIQRELSDCQFPKQPPLLMLSFPVGVRNYEIETNCF